MFAFFRLISNIIRYIEKKFCYYLHNRIDKFCKSNYNIVLSKREVYRVELTKSEMEIMDVLWGSEKPLSRADLLAHSEEKSWKDSSVHILLNGLLQKGAIREAGLVKRSKTFGRVFSPTLTREEYFAETIYSHRCKPQLVGLIRALLTQQEVTQEELTEIAQLVEQKRA